MTHDLNQATMFLNDLSVVDHAFIDNEGNVIGGSFNPSFLVTGNIDPVEKVVVDFSTVKKQLKAKIDDKDIGFDHKLWYIEGFSAADITILDTQHQIDSESTFNKLPGETIVIIQTPNALLQVPRNAIKYITNDDNNSYTLDNVGIWFQEFLNQQFPELSIVCKNTINAHVYHNDVPVHYFSYAHGLKDSTSWGCQNIGHGHLSFIQLIGSNSELANKLGELIASELDCTMFINRANVTETVYENSAVIVKYLSFSRGEFNATFLSSPRQKCTIIDTETTIEYLVEYIATTYHSQLLKAGVTELFVSEGLSKGAYKLIA